MTSGSWTNAVIRSTSASRAQAQADDAVAEALDRNLDRPRAQISSTLRPRSRREPRSRPARRPGPRSRAWYCCTSLSVLLASPRTPGGPVVVKPSISAGSPDAAPARRPRCGARPRPALLDDGRTVMVQPYVAGVDSAGETGLVFVAGRFSHGFRKGPLLTRGEGATSRLFAEEEIAPRQAVGRRTRRRRAGAGRPRVSSGAWTATTCSTPGSTWSRVRASRCCSSSSWPSRHCFSPPVPVSAAVGRGGDGPPPMRRPRAGRVRRHGCTTAHARPAQARHGPPRADGRGAGPVRSQGTHGRGDGPATHRRSAGRPGTTPSTSTATSTRRQLRDFVTSAHCWPWCSRRVEAVEVVRLLNGATDGRKALPGTIRGDLSVSNRENLVPRLGLPGVRRARDRLVVARPRLTSSGQDVAVAGSGCTRPGPGRAARTRPRRRRSLPPPRRRRSPTGSRGRPSTSAPPIAGPTIAPTHQADAGGEAERRRPDLRAVQLADVGVDHHLRAEHEHSGQQDQPVQQHLRHLTLSGAGNTAASVNQSRVTGLLPLRSEIGPASSSPSTAPMLKVSSSDSAAPSS